MISLNEFLRRAMCPYNVGDIYITTSSKSPEDMWPGTKWTKIEGRFLLASSSKYANGATGGYEDGQVINHTHTVNTYHRHALLGAKYGSDYCASGGRSGVGANSAATTTLYTDYQGNSGTTSSNPSGGVAAAGRNMPPYLAVNVWKMTSWGGIA